MPMVIRFLGGGIYMECLAEKLLLEWLRIQRLVGAERIVALYEWEVRVREYLNR